VLLFTPVQPALAQHYSGIAGLSETFIKERNSAEQAAQDFQSADPVLKLLETYDKPGEIADLEWLLGLMYGQRTGLVNPARSIEHLTKALNHELPERSRLQALVWRGNGHHQLKKYNEAIADYLRVLVGASYHDLSGGQPQIQPSTVPMFIGYGSENPENLQRIQDYHQYRAAIDLQSFLMFTRDSAVRLVKDAQKQSGIADDQIQKTLAEITPDVSRRQIVSGWLR
jgi:hypothetical protein